MHKYVKVIEIIFVSIFLCFCRNGLVKYEQFPGGFLLFSLCGQGVALGISLKSSVALPSIISSKLIVGVHLLLLLHYTFSFVLQHVSLLASFAFFYAPVKP